jgi:anti-anti-sigma factor
VPTGDIKRASDKQGGHDAHGLSIQALVCGELRTLRLSGHLDLASRVPLEDAISRMAIDGCEFVLDLRPLTFMDTSGVHVALAARDLCARRGCKLRLIPGSAAIQSVFEFTGVLDQLSFQAEASGPERELSARSVFTYAICDSEGFDFRLTPGPRQIRRIIGRAAGDSAAHHSKPVDSSTTG